MAKDFLYAPFVPVSPDGAWRGRDKTEQTYPVYVRTQHGHRLPRPPHSNAPRRPLHSSQAHPPSTVPPHTYNRACPIYRIHVSISPHPPCSDLSCPASTPPRRAPRKQNQLTSLHQPTHPHTHTPAREVTLHATFPRQPQQHQSGVSRSVAGLPHPLRTGQRFRRRSRPYRVRSRARAHSSAVGAVGFRLQKGHRETAARAS
jgi:hypothetical protein